jgi:hypothetical protein
MQNLEKEELSEEEEEEDEDPPISQGRATTQPLKNNRVVESDDDEDAEDEEDDDNEDIEFVSKKIHNPPALLTFMLLGPYGVDAYGFEVSAAFSMDTEGIEENAKTGQYNTKSMKEEKKIVADKVR